MHQCIQHPEHCVTGGLLEVHGLDCVWNEDEHLQDQRKSVQLEYVLQTTCLHVNVRMSLIITQDRYVCHLCAKNHGLAGI